MTPLKSDIVKYRLSRARDSFDDANILAENYRWNSAINRLYYAAYYAVSAILLSENVNPQTHNGIKSKFSEYFIITEKIPKKYGKIYSQLFSWRQKGDYDDLFDFDEDKVLPYFEPVKELITIIEEHIASQ
jgi:uncharacterized protein (UPF0332 family)